MIRLNIEANSLKSFVDLINEMDSPDRQQRDRGTMFELLSRTYFKNEPLYERLFDEVWTLSEVPEEYGIPKKDTGVDLVAKERETGSLVAIQCKYHAVDNAVKKSDIDSFLNEVGKSHYAWGIIVASTDKWSKNAHEALEGRDKIISRISLSQLQESQIDWSSFSYTSPASVTKQQKKTPRDHQKPAIKAVVEGFKSADRGKLIMAPGTGKTYTSMAIAEEMAKEKNGVFKVLYLVPSIQLLSQTLRGWTADSNFNMDAIAVCSDRKVTKKIGGNEFDDIAASDIGYPATTDHTKLLAYKELIESDKLKGDFLTVFSTYQSIDVIIEAQKQGFYDFDLIVCDEAHRTTGVTENGEEDSSFKKVHSNDNVRASKRLYQTATPRVYGESAKEKATDLSALLADMSDEKIYGEELYRIGFGEAVRKGILTDYKVMVLAVDEEMVARNFQQMLAADSELNFDDVTKIIGCWNGLVRRRSHSDEVLGPPMRRAIAFAGTIKESKLITDMFSHVVDQYLYKDNDESNVQYKVEIEHADGSMNALEKNKKISWLKGDVPDHTCRILSNARFLTEGVDVPDLDAIMFLKPRKSKIDIAQAVGRVMRKYPGKDYGYVILPIGVPAGTNENNVLDNNEKYKVVWEVLNALRSLDERFDATINKLDLNKSRSEHIQVIGVGEAPEDGELKPVKASQQLAMELDAEELSDLEKAIYGKIVRKVGNVRYWEDWSKDVADIADQHMMRIRVMLADTESEAYKEFNNFLSSLKHNINTAINQQQGIEMLAQHLITKPVFEALFDSYSFVNDNPVSRSMESVLKVLSECGLEKEQEGLEPFYESVRLRAQGVDNLKGKQDIIVQLYDKFFKTGFKETTERLGIVFTPVEIVDFIIKSVNDVMKEHFSKSLSDEGVHILDPFTGTGTFIVRLLQSGLISPEDLVRKYTQELHANEIVLLSYYIAAINIEETFHALNNGVYEPFNGIVLTDTFESGESKDSFIDTLFDENNLRLKKQKENQIFAIIGNPPYSAKQQSDNDNNKGKNYPELDNRIADTYVKESTAQNRANQYDSYIRAIRWSSDRIKDKGIVGFITNGSFIDSPAAEGLRACLTKEFDYVYVYNLRGFIRQKSGEAAKKEGDNVFNILQGVAILLLVKSPDNSNESCKLYYSDIGEYLNREEKLSKLTSEQSILNSSLQLIEPNEKNDWINQRNTNFNDLIILGNKKNQHNKVFAEYSGGIKSGRDTWVYNFSRNSLSENVKSMIEYYNESLTKKVSINEMSNSQKIKWTQSLRTYFDRGLSLSFDPEKVYVAMYRPFVKKHLYYDPRLIDRQYQMKKVYPLPESDNLTICFSNKTGGKEFSCLVTNVIPDVNLFAGGSQCMPLRLYNESDSETLFSNSLTQEGISSEFIEKCSLKYDTDISNETVFYYIYGYLHSPDYRLKYHQELSKEFPRIHLVDSLDDFYKIEAIGRKLANIHLNFESMDPYSELEIDYKKALPSYDVNKITFNKADKTIINFNKDITIKNVPHEALEYKLNDRPAIEWIMTQYRFSTDSDSKITDDPSLYNSDKKYILNLLLKIINVSVQTMRLVKEIPSIDFNE